MDGFVTVHRSLDPVAAEIAHDLLEQAGLAARLVGPGQSLGESRVEVAAASRAEAERILAAHADEIAPLEQPEDAEPEEPEPPGPRRLRPLLAAGVAPVCPGGGHFYAGRTIIGGLILTGQIAALVCVVAGGPRAATVAFLWAIGLFLFDLVGSQLAVRAANRGRRASRVRQATAGAVVLAAVGFVAALTAPFVDRLHAGRRGSSARGRASGDAWRAGATRPEDLPFPFHLDLTR